MGILGAFVSIIEDSELTALKSVYVKRINEMVDDWLDIFRNITNPELHEYVLKSRDVIKNSKKEEFLDANILDIIYRILSFNPFSYWKENDPEKSCRIGKLTKLFESFISTPIPGYPGSTRGLLKTSKIEGPGNISFNWRRNFYYTFVGLLNSEGINDPEDEEIITPPDRLPIMTVHQAKGLEFPFVFVYKLTDDAIKIDSAVQLEDDLEHLRKIPRITTFSPFERTLHDTIRFYYVAYSRAQYAQINLIPYAHKRRGLGYIGNNFREYECIAKRLL